MRKLIFAIASLFVFVGASQAAAQEAPVDTEAATWTDDNCQGRAVGPRRARACVTAYSAVRRCTYEIDVRASALRFASGRRRHARIARCTTEAA